MDSEIMETVVYIWGCKNGFYENGKEEAPRRQNGKDEVRCSFTVNPADLIKELDRGARLKGGILPKGPDYQSRQQAEYDSDGTQNLSQIDSPHTLTENYSSDTIPLIITSLSQFIIKSVCSGELHAIFLCEQGQVYTYGSGFHGQLGLGDEVQFTRQPQGVEFYELDTKINHIACGKQHSVALSHTGHVWIWGEASALGIRGSSNEFKPYKLDSQDFFEGKAVTFVAAGYNQTMAYVYLSEISIGNLFIWGESFQNTYYSIPQKFENCFEDPHLKKISLARNAAFALTYSGLVYVWGDGTYGETGTKDLTESARTQYEGRLTTVKNGLSRKFSHARYVELNLTDHTGEVLSQIVDIQTGDHHVILLTTSGSVYAFGDNNYGQCGITSSITRLPMIRQVNLRVGKSLKSAKHIAAGGRHSAVVTDQGLLMTWGHAANHKLIHTALSIYLLHSQTGIKEEHVGISRYTGFETHCPEVKPIYEHSH